MLCTLISNFGANSALAEAPSNPGAKGRAPFAAQQDQPCIFHSSSMKMQDIFGLALISHLIGNSSKWGHELKACNLSREVQDKAPRGPLLSTGSSKRKRWAKSRPCLWLRRTASTLNLTLHPSQTLMSLASNNLSCSRGAKQLQGCLPFPQAAGGKSACYSPLLSFKLQNHTAHILLPPQALLPLPSHRMSCPHYFSLAMELSKYLLAKIFVIYNIL